MLALGALVMVWLGPIEGLGDEASLESLDRARRELAFGASAYQADADISTPVTALSFLPVGLGYFLLAPAPWQVWNTRQLLTLPEMLAWYALLPQVVSGFLVASRRRLCGKRGGGGGEHGRNEQCCKRSGHNRSPAGCAGIWPGCSSVNRSVSEKKGPVLTSLIAMQSSR